MKKNRLLKKSVNILSINQNDRKPIIDFHEGKSVLSSLTIDHSTVRSFTIYNVFIKVRTAIEFFETLNSLINAK